MYYVLSCECKVTPRSGRAFKFNHVNSVEIVSTIDALDTTCVVRIPATSKWKSVDGEVSNVENVTKFNVGDKIEVWLGMDKNKRKKEFVGYIKSVDNAQVMTLECIGYEYELTNSLKTRTFAKTNLKELMQYIIADTSITLHGDVPTVEMTNYVVPADITAREALQQIKERYGLTIYLSGSELYAGLDFVPRKGTAKYSLGVNTIGTNELKHSTQDRKIKIKAVLVRKDNTKLEIEVGEPKGEQRTLFFYDSDSAEDLKTRAEAQLSKLNYSGYRGKLTTFLLPYAMPAMVAEVRDIHQPSRDGKYEIRTVTVRFTTSGGRRIIELGKKIS